MYKIIWWTHVVNLVLNFKRCGLYLGSKSDSFFTNFWKPEVLNISIKLGKRQEVLSQRKD